MGAQASKDRILDEIGKRLCSQNAHIREQNWRSLVRDLRRLGRDPATASDALTEFLSVTVSKGGVHGLGPRDYHKLSVADKAEVDSRYQGCLKEAMDKLRFIFQVDVINVPTSPADVVLAERAAPKALPRLNADQQSLAKALGIPDQDYKRTVLAKQYSEDRYRFYAERCWDLLIDATNGKPVDAVGVVYDVSSGKFNCEILLGGSARRFALNARIVWEPLEAGDSAGLDKAREAIRFGVEQVLAPRLEPAGSAVGR